MEFIKKIFSLKINLFLLFINIYSLIILKIFLKQILLYILIILLLIINIKIQFFQINNFTKLKNILKNHIVMTFFSIQKKFQFFWKI